VRGPKTTFNLIRKTQTQDSGGGWDPSDSQIAELKGVLRELSQQEQLSLDRNTIVATHRLQVDRKALASQNRSELAATNRIKIGTTKYEITGVTDHPGRGRHWNVNLRLVE